MEETNTGAEVDTNQDTSAGVDDAGQGGATDNVDVANGGEAEAAGNPQGEEAQDEEIVENEGKKFIPYERFTQINERLKAAEEKANLLESIKTDPAKRQEFVEALGLNEKKEEPTGSNQGAPQPAPFQKFLSESVDPQYHAHYTTMAQAMASELEQYVESKIAPLVNAIGHFKVREVESKIPDFGKYSRAVTEIMSKNPGLDPEQAYKLASYDDRFKAGMTTGMKKTQQHQQKVSKTPITKQGGSPGVSAADKPKSFGESFERAWTKVNGPNQ